MSSIEDLKVYLTYPHDCSYLPRRKATTLFVAPESHVDTALYSELSRHGFRRSGPHYYRPRCVSCNACVSCRVVTEEFVPNRSQKRTLKRNSDLRAEQLISIDNEECYDLYTRYIEQRHADGDMYPPTRSQYDSFLGTRGASTFYLGFYKGETLLAVAVVDHLDDGLSAIYTFYDPHETQRSLGVYVILWQIDYALNRLQLPYVYLGYWVSGCRKMNYKQQYAPLEYYRGGCWSRQSEEED